MSFICVLISIVVLIVVGVVGVVMLSSTLPVALFVVVVVVSLGAKKLHKRRER